MAQPRALFAFAVFCSAFVAARAAAPNATCDLLFDGTPISDSSWNSALNVSRYVGNLKDDTAAEAEYLVLTTKEVTAFTFNSPSDYVDVRFDNPPITLKLVVMEAFTNYEEDMISATDPSIIDVGVQFSCSDGNTVPFIFRITVEDVNKHAPVFEQSSYNCTLPMPCPPDSDLSSFMVDINVRDIDFSNQAITIHFDEEGEQLFTAETTYKGNRVYAVQLYSKATINLAETANFTVTAVDSGTPALTSDPVTIVVSGYNVN
ncbi:uncharacterized protein LOC126285013 [Schistocerca gregaria]|uniref:uncharacterized protein LOC126285013 n=1 Tax=Schistocerca gregaria TaxID=7010 RepID=UPI00211DBDEB|nr:uncharacterized protein LOC126285013 [Schistocerca gregaria]